MFNKFYDSPHFYFSLFEKYHDVSEWNSLFAELDPNFNNEHFILKVVKQNLEYFYIEKGVDILKEYKKFKQPDLKLIKAEFDYLNGRKIDED